MRGSRREPEEMRVWEARRIEEKGWKGREGRVEKRERE